MKRKGANSVRVKGMYMFLVHLYDMKNECDVFKEIEVPYAGGAFDCEKDIYMYAMSKAYDLTEESHDLSFEKLELVFIS